MIRALLVAHPLALAIAVLWLLLTVAIVVAGWRNAFDADRSEQEIEVAQDRVTLARYRERALLNARPAGSPLRGVADRSSNLRRQ